MARVKLVQLIKQHSWRIHQEGKRNYMNRRQHSIFLEISSYHEYTLAIRC
jgi:hypothetical protein